MNLNVNKEDQSKAKLLKIFELLRDSCSQGKIIIPKSLNPNIVLRKLYKYISKIHIANVNFAELEEIDKEKLNLLGIDEQWIKIKIVIKEWIFNLFSACNYMIETNEPINSQMEFFLLNCFNVIKEICRNPPKELIHFNQKSEIRKELLYVILDYFIILNERDSFAKVFDLMTSYSENTKISYKFLVILKKFCLKHFSYLSNVRSLSLNSHSTSEQNLISEIIDQNDEFLIIPGTKKDDAFKKFIEITINSLKTNIKEVDKSKRKTSIFSLFFTKNKTRLSKELDGSNIMDFFTILNTSEEYSPAHLNNTAVFSVCYELIKFIFQTVSSPNSNEEANEKIMVLFKEIKSVLHSYCIRIFDQSENYLESNKNKTVIDKNTEYNLNLIEAAVWESVKIINLICKLDTTLVSNINMRMKQVYERIALKQSGLVFLEILQFFIDNCDLIIIDLDYYVSEFFKLKLKYNYKYEILSFTTLEFLYKNKEILDKKTQIFNSFFPLIIKIFATFPKYLDTKFFKLVEYMTKPTTITELFNYILDLPAIILIIENFESFTPFNSEVNTGTINIDDIFQAKFIPTIELLLRDVAFEQEFQFNCIYTPLFNENIQCIFKSLEPTARVNSTTKIVPKLMKKFFNVIIQRDEFESASETIVLIFERFSHFHENDHYPQVIRNLLIREIEEMFKKWPKIVTLLRENILKQIKKYYGNKTKRELICLLCWSLGEFLDKQHDNSFEDPGIAETFDCLEMLLRDKIKFFQAKRNEKEVNKTINNESVEDVLKWYSTYFLDKTTEEEVNNERLLIIIINTLCKLAVKFKSYVSRIIKCFKDVNVGLSSTNKNIYDKLCEMLVSLEHISISTEYFI